MPISGSFLRGNGAGRMAQLNHAIKDINNANSGSFMFGSFGAINGDNENARPFTPSFISSSFRERGVAEPKVIGYFDKMVFGDFSTVDVNGMSTAMQVGISRENNDGSPTPPSLMVTYPGSFWRFRWVVKTGTRNLTVAAKQNFTGSAYAPSIVIRKNTSIGLMADISASSPGGAGWQTIGPLSFTVSGSDIVWVEMHNNNNSWSMSPSDGSLISAPCWFDHIVAS